jgi:Thioredoxin reductase
MKILDILIIGGGPIGLNCALEAQKNDLDYLIIEKGTIVNSLYNYPLYMTFFFNRRKTSDRWHSLYFRSSQTGKKGSIGILSRDCPTKKYQHSSL